MLVLLSSVLVVAATVFLVLGLLVSDGLPLIYVSIGLSALAALLLVLFVRTSRTASPASGGSEPAPPDDHARERTDDVEFPIADYHELTVDEVMGLLPQLYSDELDVVEARERQGLERAVVLERLAQLRVTGTDADRALDDDVDDNDVIEDIEDVQDDYDVQDDEDVWDHGPELPISAYDELAVSEVVPLLSDLDEDELTEIRAHEVATKNRRIVVAAIDRQLGVVARSAATPSSPPGVPPGHR